MLKNKLSEKDIKEFNASMEVRKSDFYETEGAGLKLLKGAQELNSAMKTILDPIAQGRVGVELFPLDRIMGDESSCIFRKAAQNTAKVFNQGKSINNASVELDGKKTGKTMVFSTVIENKPIIELIDKDMEETAKQRLLISKGKEALKIEEKKLEEVRKQDENGQINTLGFNHENLWGKYVSELPKTKEEWSEEEILEKIKLAKDATNCGTDCVTVDDNIFTLGGFELSEECHPLQSQVEKIDLKMKDHSPRNFRFK